MHPRILRNYDPTDGTIILSLDPTDRLLRPLKFRFRGDETIYEWEGEILEKYELEEPVSPEHSADFPEDPVEGGWVQNAVEHLRHPGAFSQKAQQAHLSTRDFARRVLQNPSSYDVETRRQAQFFRNINHHNR